MAVELINSTPFVPLQFEAIDKQLNMFGVIVLRASFDIRHGERLGLAAEQLPPVLEDQYFGAPGASSLRWESALAPYKPKTDVMIEATAYSPSGAAEAEWIAGVTVGPLSKTFRVTGPRSWTRKFGLPKLADPEPIESLPVRYEHAFGGTSPVDSEVRHAANPVGVGFQGAGSDDERCPQLLPIGVDSLEYGRPMEVIGLGPVAPAWQPRIQHAGTADENWARTRAPYLPLDFSYEFYNAAAPGLTFSGFARGDEIVTLTNLSRERRLEFGLPGIEMITVIQFEDGRWIPGPMNLDTIELQVDEGKVFLQWRGIFPSHIPTRRIELRMSAPDYLVEA